MKTARQQKNTGEVSVKSKADAGLSCTRIKASVKKIGGRRKKATGKSDANLTKKDEHLVPSSAQTICQQLPVKETGNSNIVTTVETELGQTLQPSAKIRLQLFPIDEGTRTGLEKDGHNPHLELTLRARKKLVSVLNHLHNKWGSSSVAVGELMLLPYNVRLENLAGYRRWTLKDSAISAADVYEAIGKPLIFRLRYGWFSDLESKTHNKSPTSNNIRGSSQFGDIHKSFSENVECMNGDKQPLEDNLRASNTATPSSLGWADSLTNISMGGLLSEASLQGNVNRCDPMPIGGSSLQQLPFSSDSFDAAIAAHIYGRSQGSIPSSHVSHSSIFDAEETCHAFPFQKFCSSGKEFVAASRSGACSQDASLKPFKFPTLVEEEAQTGSTQDQTEEPKADLLLQRQGADNGENSLGMPDINWSDSLWSPDLSLSSSRQIISGDSINFSSLLSSSLDAFQSRSFFLRDEKVPPT
ncbi:PREDICTED: TSL-kinase interacting protein 1-like [Nelumbo nucifera]|uniref:TSL-kinase interacting protein 1-like n=2 Tax=Nelumbo nucifera TaxID=4432 RepID=A0A1U8AGC3_NELNU|nr:PREDICTED: TSL-kinase interacting protein 1-like [Nelumbo nucifera]XP_019053755.1 PREDICTED: TSL-kinase interacting protein 1-like [Nelumbo nucifera]DAD40115.1 TPA_asm: hypothetical protein HUJ06_014438 [Nelumbo nucifera]